MDIATIATLILGNGAIILPLFLWNRSESRADIRHMDNKLDISIRTIQEESRDFHGRLCAIEERYRKEKP